MYLIIHIYIKANYGLILPLRMYYCQFLLSKERILTKKIHKII